MKRIFLLGSFLFAFVGKAQDKNKVQQSYSLKEAIKYATENNRYVKNANLNIKGAKARKWETTAIGLPQITAKIDYLNGIEQQFQGVDFNGDGIIDIAPKHNITPSITATQLIFDGSYIVGLESAKVFLQISEDAKTKTKNQIEIETTKAYLNALLIKHSIELTEKNITELKANVSDTKKIYEQGLIEEESVEQLELTLNSLENNLNKLKQLDNIALNALKSVFSVERNTEIKLTDDLFQLFGLANLKEKKAYSIANNIDVRIAENNVEAKRLLNKLEKFKRLPSVGAFLQGNYIGNSNDFSGLFGNGDIYVPTLNFGVSITIPIFNSGAEFSAMKRTKMDYEVAKNDLLNQKSQTQIALDNAVTEYDFSVKALENKKKNLDLTKKIKDKNETKFKEGIVSSMDFRQTQMQYYAAQQEYLQSIVAVINNKAAVQNLTK